MRARSPEKRTRQKVVQQPVLRIENEHNPEALPQYFQVTVNVIEARKLAWSNHHTATSYVIVILGKKKHRTSIRRNMAEPDYREHFTFELYQNIREFQRTTLWLGIMEAKCYAPPRLIGKANIDLGTVWAQPFHQVFHKWVQLGLPRDHGVGATGFLKVDVSIMHRGDEQVMPAILNDDKIEDNLLLPSEPELQRAKYLITIYRAYGLPTAWQKEGRFDKPSSTFVRLSFCGLVAKTSIQPSTKPLYCEQISIVEMFPNMCELIRFEVCSGEGCYNKILASSQIRLGLISHDGENGFLPTFGPSLLHIYGTSALGSSNTANDDGPYHRGALLISLETIVPYCQDEIRTVTVEPVPEISLESLWVNENFCVLCPVFEVSMLDHRFTGRFCGVAITIGEIPGNDNEDEDFLAMMNEIKSRKLHYTGSLEIQKTKPPYGYLNLSDPYPVLQLAINLPDFRFRMYRENMIHGIVENLVTSVSDIQRRLMSQDFITLEDLIDDLNKAMDDTAGKILKFLNILKYCCTASAYEALSKSCCTELDHKQLKLQKESMEKIYHQITKGKIATFKPLEAYGIDYQITSNSTRSKKEVKIMIAEVKTLIESFRNLIFKSSDGWPDIVVWLLNGGSRVAYTKIPAADVVDSIIPEQCGRMCGKIQTIYMKPLKCPKHISTSTANCNCIAGKLELMIWMGLYRQMGAFENHIPYGYKLGIKDYDIYMKSNKTLMLEFRVYVYRAKLNTGIVNSIPVSPFVRVNVLNSVEDTLTIQKTATPIWNQMLKISIMANTTPERLLMFPPYVLVEVLDYDASNKTELIGRFQLQPVLGDRQNYDSAPKLKWYDLYNGEKLSGRLLMSVELIQIPETVLKTTLYSTEEETYYVTAAKESDQCSECVQHLPKSILPKLIRYKLDVFWWGLRNLNVTRKPCVVLELDDVKIKSDTINGNTKNCNFPNHQMTQIFEAALFESYCPPMTIHLFDSSTFGRTIFLGTKTIKDPKKYMVKCFSKSIRDMSLRRSSIMTPDFVQVTQMLYVMKVPSRSKNTNDSTCIKSQKSVQSQKQSTWRNFFMKSVDEEEYALLPIQKKESDLGVMEKINSKLDWWHRFNASKKQIYDEDKMDTNDRITIYNRELESQPEFSRFKDWCSTIKLYSGKKTGIPEQDTKLHCGFLKAGIAIYEWPSTDDNAAVGLNGVDLSKGYFSEYPDNETKKFLIRVYIIKGINLKPKDFSGKCDPYIIISCGDKHLGNRSGYIPNTTNPIFGRMYEFRCILPEDYLFTVSIYDSYLEDELIGSTSIDVEDRIFTKHRARIGLPLKYRTTGPNKWHGLWKPSKILENLCVKNHISPPQYPDLNTVVLNEVEYRDNDMTDFPHKCDKKENICLNLLHNWHTMPICGHHLVPEHVETRSLYKPDEPGYEQGKLQMWVDIFPMNAHIFLPPPVDITPQKEKDYELRVIVWDVINFNIHQKEKEEVDLYVKAWIGSVENAQYTDVHYRSIFGKGSFNWRMIFHFQYKPIERKLIRKEKGPFTEIEEYMEPVFIVQVLESEIELAMQNEITASLALNLNYMPRGFIKASQCDLAIMQNSRKINLFTMRSVRAWWPLKNTNHNTGYSRNVGSIELELMLLPMEKAILMPVGLGREPPAPLPFPDRHSSSLTCRMFEKCYRHGAVELLAGLIITTILVSSIFYWKLPTLVYDFLLEE